MIDLKYKCLEGFHAKYCSKDTKSNVEKISAFRELMGSNFSGENIKARVVDNNTSWQIMLRSKGFGRSRRIKIEGYKANIILVWNDICSLIDSGNQEDTFHAYAEYVWGLEKNEYEPHPLSITESLVMFNKLWKNKNMADIFVDYFGFLFDHSMTLDEIAQESLLTTERIRQLKNKCLDEFNEKFSFFKEPIFRKIFDSYFDNYDFSNDNILKFKIWANNNYEVNFSSQFYCKIIGLVYGLHIVGNLNDIKSQNSSSSKGNVWSNIYLQTNEQKNNFDLDAFVDLIGELNYKSKGHFKKNIEISLDDYVASSLSTEEVSLYSQVLDSEFEVEIVLNSKSAIIKRNSYVSKYEYVEKILTSLGGLEYIDIIVLKLNQVYPEVDKWSEGVVRSTVLRQDEFYTVGKSGLYGLKTLNDVREIAGNGTLNDILKLHLESKDVPIHLYDLMINVNKIFPRKKSIHTIHSILEQDSQDLFVKLTGGFYGLKSKTYEVADFPRIRGFHGRILRSEIRDNKSETFSQLLENINSKVDILPVQLEYLLFQAVERKDLILTDDTYSINEDQDVDEINYEIKDHLSQEIYSRISEINADDDDFLDHSEYDLDPNVQIKIRRGQPRFRKALLFLYKSTCIITNCKIGSVLEAAHVMPHSETVNYSLSNGLLLRADIHTLFDANMIAIDPGTMKLEMHPSLLTDSTYSEYQYIDIGKRIKNLHEGYCLDDLSLLWRWKIFQESY
jgi:hypothetical protein